MRLRPTGSAAYPTLAPPTERPARPDHPTRSGRPGRARRAARAVGVVAAGLVLLGAAWPASVGAAGRPGGVAAEPDPESCTRTALPSGGGDHVVCARGLRPFEQVLGTPGDDLIEVTGSVTGLVDGGEGDDELIVERIDAVGSGEGLRGTVRGGPGADDITVTDPSDQAVRGNIDGGPGDDGITTAGTDGGIVTGGDGDDEITTGRVASIWVVGAGVTGGAGHDVIRTGPIGLPGARSPFGVVGGGAGEDLIEADTSSQPAVGAFFGDGEDDVIRGRDGAPLRLQADSYVDGGAGVNTCVVDTQWGGRLYNCQP
ncbi:hypothetical protein [Streptomyces sp. NPDC057702]|uniref:hypothetical protein n=1 Tax=unclassified Streptomyces TaxID=2593676 RepID=UPI0036C2F69C